MKSKKLFFIIFLIVGGSSVYSQNPDTSLPNIYKDILPGFKSEKLEKNPLQDNLYEDQEDKQNNLNELEEIQNRKSLLLIIKEFLENKTLVNMIILIIIFSIFFAYRIKKFTNF